MLARFVRMTSVSGAGGPARTSVAAEGEVEAELTTFTSTSVDRVAFGRGA